MKNNQISIHIDSTGTIVRHPLLYLSITSNNLKQNYYYACIINCKLVDGKSGLNYLLLITDCHTSYNIEIWLRFFENYLKKRVNDNWPPFTNAVLDFSKANLNVISLAWNNIELNTYINFIYTNLENLSELRNFVYIHLCYANLVKNFEKFIAKHCDKDQVKKLNTILRDITNELNYNITRNKIYTLFKICTETWEEISNTYLLEFSNILDIDEECENTDEYERYKNDFSLTNYDNNKF